MKAFLHRMLVLITGMPDALEAPVASAGAPMDRTFTVTLEEYAALVQLVDEGMWELSANGEVRLAHESVCALLGMEPYCAEDFAAGVPHRAGAAS